MPIDERHRDAIATAVAAYDRAADGPLPRNATRLLAVMFSAKDVCHQSLEALAAEGFNRKGCPRRYGVWRRRDCCLGSEVRPAFPIPTASICRRWRAMRIASREKVFGASSAVPLDRNAKARIAAYARAWSARNRLPGQATQGSDHQGLPGRPGRLAVGLPQQPLRYLLPRLRGDRCKGRVCALNRGRSIEGASAASRCVS